MIRVLVIPHDQQRYETAGDWFYSDDGTLEIRVSKLDDWRMEACIAVHEIVEALLCKYDGVSVEAVDAFDIAFEARRQAGNIDEPGDDIACPCYRQHQIATAVERILAMMMWISWAEYEKKINALNKTINP